MHRVAYALALALGVAACSAATPPATTSSTTTTVATSAPTTTTSLPLPEFGALVWTEGTLLALPDGPELFAGIGRDLGAAFDDVGGGIVFEQLIDGEWQTWRLEAGRREPVELGVPGARLGDVDFLGDRPVTAALWSEDAILLQTVKGGAPEVLVLDDLELPAGEVSGVTLGGTSIAVATTDGQCHDVTLLAVDGSIERGPFGLCAMTPPAVTSDGEIVVHLDIGASTRVVFVDAEDMSEITRVQVQDDVVAVTAGAKDAVVTLPDAVHRLDDAGNVEVLDWDPKGTPLGATALRAPLVVSDLASLGGVAIPTECSAGRLPEPADQSGLSTDANLTRTAIYRAAIDCDYWRLAALAGPEFDGPDDLTRLLIEAEAEDIPATADVVRTLGLPHAANGESPGIVFVWPSILGDEPTDEDWAALRLVYNEERIEEWRTGRGPFDGMWLTIDEQGRWTGLGGLDG